MDWCGGDKFDGCLIFDECHKAKNFIPVSTNKRFLLCITYELTAQPLNLQKKTLLLFIRCLLPGTLRQSVSFLFLEIMCWSLELLKIISVGWSASIMSAK